ncbi:hypothetical protein Daura_22510 [Dactylosporangium aurantiacum]|uniref:Uncharacterized protein n=1 Tax=Dactylosporangium aurantiacum TaxID=35754 RepID=A0A9Q9MRN8_9ACTN|nr:hypothetical protein [Dactylosporangium aurantiacum]MDG6107718.1 hypothetical protein [Dactylosporangium aurantiacum]UWZ58692.1 hypothetical protein Daura_22510 [Dactylosporangium aurantiacum]
MHRRVRSAGSFRDGPLRNALNPEAAVFIVGLLPQFLPAHTAVVPMLSLIAAVVTTVWFLTVVDLAAAGHPTTSAALIDGMLDASEVVLCGSCAIMLSRARRPVTSPATWRATSRSFHPRFI